MRTTANLMSNRTKIAAMSPSWKKTNIGCYRDVRIK